MKIRNLTRSAYHAGRKCAKRLYFDWNSPELAQTDGSADYHIDLANRIRTAAARMAQGIHLPVSARTQEKAEAMDMFLHSQEPAISGGYLQSDRLAGQIHTIIRSGDGFVIREIKSGQSLKPEYVDDAAFQLLLARRCGLNVVRVEVLTLSSSISFEDLDRPERMFQVHDVTQETTERLADIESSINDLLESIESGEAEQIQPSHSCEKECPYYDHCFAAVPDDSLIFLPQLRGSKLAEIKANGYLTVADLPSDFALSKTQVPFVELFRNGGEVWMSPVLESELARITFPALFIDFETCRPPLPLNERIPGGKSIWFQWSAHMLLDPDDLPAHYEFLDLISDDPHGNCLAELLPLMRAASSIVHWSHAEKTTIDKLDCTDPDIHAEAQRLLAAKSVDLEKIVKTNLLHAKFRNRTSIKSVLAALHPTAYEGLAIQSGRIAEITYLQAKRGELTTEQIEQKRADLLAYCQRDTQAMIDIYHAIRKLIKN